MYVTISIVYLCNFCVGTDLLCLLFTYYAYFLPIMLCRSATYYEIMPKIIITQRSDYNRFIQLLIIIMRHHL